jgi:ABC-2 type transport system permease protein
LTCAFWRAPTPRARAVKAQETQTLSVVTELWTYRGLVYNLAERDLRSRYRRSVLGWTWSLINPAATLAIYTLVFGTFLRVVPPPANNPDASYFAIYLFAALLTWNFFSSVLTGSINSLFGMGSLLNKVYFPPESPALANVAGVVLQALIEAFLLVVVLAILQNLFWTVLLFPLLLVVLGLFALGFGLALSVYNVLYRDVGYLVTIALQVLFFLTPITYTLDLVPEDFHGIPLQRIFELNPMTQFVTVSRDLFYFGKVPSIGSVLYLTALSVVVVLVGWRIFTRKARLVVEEL